MLCAECRAVTPRDDVESIHYTETQRWDALTDVAKAWSAIDHRAGEESSEEELSEYFDHGDQSRFVLIYAFL